MRSFSRCVSEGLLILRKQYINSLRLLSIPFSENPLPYGSEAAELRFTSYVQHIDQPQRNNQEEDQADDRNDGVKQRGAHQAATQVQALEKRR